MCSVLCPAPAALSKPHLLEGKGHNRQASDGSVDRFIPKEELLEPADPDSKVSRPGRLNQPHTRGPTPASWMGWDGMEHVLA